MSPTLRSNPGGCTMFTVGTSHTYDTDTSPDLSKRYSTLCTNSVPLTRSNDTSHDTRFQTKVSTPFAESTASAGRSNPPTSLLGISRDTVQDALEYGIRCDQARMMMPSLHHYGQLVTERWHRIQGSRLYPKASRYVLHSLR
ncbi:hypothetical protein BD769DRAFT_711776 [Suillus cothurnatus]|nr:hypothetical protein BD769DRAFT_711776 [Suillus cothurnatus]